VNHVELLLNQQIGGLIVFGWLKKKMRFDSSRPHRHFLLYRNGCRVEASDATHLDSDREYAMALLFEGRRYLRVDHEDTFVFWDELRDASGRTIGYTFEPSDSKVFANARLWTESENVTFEYGEFRVLLYECTTPIWECVQGFGSELYQNESDPQDCILLFYDFSKNAIAFDLQSARAYPT
jgi:hypothetical protein